MIKAAFFDVDGTLVSHKTKSVPQSARDALEKLRASGVKCIVATGRHLREMQRLPVKDLPFDGYITLNGQLILDENREMLHGVPITGRAREILLRMFEARELPLLLIAEDANYLNFVDDRVRTVHQAISTPIPPLVPYEGQTLYQACAYLEEAEEHLLRALEGECLITRWGFGGVDIVAKGGGKAAGIRRYLEHNGMKTSEIIAFGDAQNDLDMLELAAIGVAMGNAAEEVKQAADYVTADIDDDGIARALKHFGLIE